MVGIGRNDRGWDEAKAIWRRFLAVFVKPHEVFSLKMQLTLVRSQIQRIQSLLIRLSAMIPHSITSKTVIYL
jgi:hypothetical protein